VAGDSNAVRLHRAGEARERNARWLKKYKLSREEVAQILENFLEGKGRPLEWDGFTLGMSFEDEFLEKIRKRCAGMSQEFPSNNSHEYCNEQGRDFIRGYIKQLRGMI
jgi:hypothetical protein